MRKVLGCMGLLTAGIITGFAACIHLYNMVEEEVHTDEYDENDFEVTDV